MRDSDEDTMREDDKTIFVNAAKIFEVWILVRATNPKSLEYIGKFDYLNRRVLPKPIPCKAKTADRGRNAGLVVAYDAVDLCSYNSEKFGTAKHAWESFMSSQGVKNSSALNKKPNSRFMVDLDTKSPRYGCVMLITKDRRENYLHADYDIKDIIPEGVEKDNVALLHRFHGQPHMLDPYLRTVMSYVNPKIGFGAVEDDPLFWLGVVQHGGEAQFADHEEDLIHVFAPSGERRMLKNKQEILIFYTGLERRTGIPNKYGVKKIDVLNSPSSYLEFEAFAIRWFEQHFSEPERMARAKKLSC